MVCYLCKENEGTINMWYDGIKSICKKCADELSNGIEFEKSPEEIIKKLKEDREKIDKKLIKNLKKMSDKQLLLEHEEITSRPIQRFLCSYLGELNKKIKLRNLNINYYDDFNESITVEDFEKYLENNKVDEDYTFSDYKMDVLKAREELISSINRIVEG